MDLEKKRKEKNEWTGKVEIRRRKTFLVVSRACMAII